MSVNFANNPQTFMNSFQSATRNVFLTSSIGIAMYGFSNTFQLDMSVNLIKLLSILIFIFSFFLGLNSVIMMKRYLKILRKNKDILPNYVDLEIWRNYLYINYFYLCLLLVIISLTTIRLINRIL
jgi:hypothetical protein